MFDKNISEYKINIIYKCIYVDKNYIFMINNNFIFL